MAAGKVALSGNGGLPLAPFYLSGSQNLSQPLSNWSIVTTNQFDTSGAFQLTNIAASDNLRTFYRLQVP